MRIIFYTTAAILAIEPAFGQKFEFGVAGGGSFYNSREITNSRGNANAGFDNGWAASVNIGNNMYSHVGGEIRYTYLKNDAKLESGSGNAKFSAVAHAIHYDFLLHATDVNANIRPYVAIGGGVKWFTGTGNEVAAQPLSNIALLTKTTEVKGLLSVGAGVKFRLSNRILLRLDAHDYLTPFPTKVITPSPGSTSPEGLINNIVATVGITLTN